MFKFDHAKIETNATLLMVLSLVVVSIGGIVEIAPLFYLQNTIEKVEGVRPYSPLELKGRNIYIREGCYLCHSQMIRPFYWETKRYGDYSKPGEFVYDRPFQWGSRRIGPDLAREGGRKSHLWHYEHFKNPADTSPDSIMPRYPWLLSKEINFPAIQGRVDANAMLGVPYGELVIDGAAEEHALFQAATIAMELEEQGGPSYEETQDKQVIALIAYLQRLGVDLYKDAPAIEEEVSE